MNLYLRLHNLLRIFTIIVGVCLSINTTQTYSQPKSDSADPDMFPVFCGRFIVLENHVPERLINSKKIYEIGFFEQEINRFQAYVLATSDHSLMEQYKKKYLGRKLALQDDKGNSNIVKIKNIILMGTFCPHFGTHDDWQARLSQSSNSKATEEVIAQEMWKEAGKGGVFIVGVTDSVLKSNNMFASTKTDKRIAVFRKKMVPYEMHDRIKAAFEKTPAYESLNAFLKKEKLETEKEEKFQGIEGEGKEFVFYFISAWVDDGENGPWKSADFRAGCCWEVSNNVLIPVNNLDVKYLERKIFFDANNNNIPDYYTVELLQYFYFCIDGQNKKSVSIPYHDCGM